jgi:hypothetical protein
MRFGLFIHGHHIDAFLPGVGIATLELLERFHAAPSHESAHPRWVVRSQASRTNHGSWFVPLGVSLTVELLFFRRVGKRTWRGDKAVR